MPARERLKRVLRRTTRVVLIFLAGLAIYVSQYFTAFWLAGDGMLWTRPFNFMRDTIFYPIEWCAHTPLPMSPYVEATAEWCYARGNGKEITWSEWYAYCEGLRTGTPVQRPQPD